MSPTYILRLGSGPYVWLKREVPTIEWGPRDQALAFKTPLEAHLARSRLSLFAPLVIEEIASLP